MKFDYIIAGAGLAGATAALSLAAKSSVLLIDPRDAASASAAAAAGLANPLMSIRARPAWRMDEALEALETLITEAGADHLMAARGLVRPAGSPVQAADFKVSAAERPDVASWMDPGAAAEEFPWLNAPHGTLRLHRGGGLSIPALLNRVLGTVVNRKGMVLFGQRLSGWSEEAGCVLVRIADEEGAERQFLAKRLILALGAGYRHFEELDRLDLHPIKGQLVRVKAPSCVHTMLPVSGGGYLVPEGSSVLVGSTYEHRFEDTAPRRAVSRRLLTRAQKVVPCLDGAEIRNEYAGLRVTVPRTRLPMVGPLGDGSRTWIVSGLGSRGLLTAPLIASRLPDWLENPEAVPRSIALRYRS